MISAVRNVRFLKVLETDQPAAQNLILHKRDGGTMESQVEPYLPRSETPTVLLLKFWSSSILWKRRYTHDCRRCMIRAL